MHKVFIVFFLSEKIYFLSIFVDLFLDTRYGEKD